MARLQKGETVKHWLKKWLGDEQFAFPRSYAGILSEIERLPSGQELSVVLKDSPKPLQALLGARFSGAVLCGITENAGGTWEVRIQKSVKRARSEGCCGICGND